MDYLVFAGNSNKKLAQSIVSKLGMRLGDADVRKFSDGEIFVRINESVRGRDVFLIQSTCAPAEEHLIEMMIMVDALKRASANTVTAIMPYFGYARQDRTSEPRVPITAKLVANLLTKSGIDRVVTMNLHAGQIQGFFDIPVDNLYSSPVFDVYFRENGMHGEDYVVVSPDAGGVARARAYSKLLGTTLAIVDKRRERANVAEAMHVIGDVNNKKVILIDDMIDTAGTLTQAAKACIEHGATEVYASAAHGVLSGPAIERILDSPLKKVIITDSIPFDKAVSKIEVLSVASLLAEAITRIYQKESISSLFATGQV
ncbi:ribose-phosphate pyrophosphokinase [Denitrovibrio acetiphilus DSM 12809]|uniref:Ribose-phosphate pyrophosphokinase n=1 Tax=Denitrovibrio acetiphilus (strain DSM 12809 / NBRC 114555 / N2460) TaxID=522772 RepID=D4H1C8_DENA2|nr:ribose-phosphate pyrophosphokinase [Denitrovibrio acetiphilus]ADD66876.1 ribose-phosphate pyrophosphokinase [Denitrovibrio acetiphilus DSM 12809]